MDILDLLPEITWPCLQKAYLRNVRTKCSSLVDFIQRHRQTMGILRIDGAGMTADDWAEFCELETVEERWAAGKILESVNLSTIEGSEERGKYLEATDSEARLTDQSAW